MPANSTNGSEFRLILSKLRDLEKNLENTSNDTLARQIEEIRDSVKIIEGNHTTLADELLGKLKSTGEALKKQMQDGFDILNARMDFLEARMTEVGETTPENSGGKKRRVERNADLSVSQSLTLLTWIILKDLNKVNVLLFPQV